MPRRARTRWIGLIPVLIAAALAIWSLDFGLPYLFRPDEDVMVGRAVRMAAEGSLDPLFANYPPLVFYIFAIVEKATGQLSGAAGPDPSGAYLAARAVSAAAAAATAGLVFLAGRRAFGTAAGLLAGLLMAVAPLAVRQAHFATTDFVQTAFVAGAVLAAFSARSRRGFLLAGALCGLAAASKYTGGIVLLVPLGLALRHADARALAAATVAAAAAAFALPSAVVVAHPGAYLSGLGFLGDRAYGASLMPIGWLYHPVVTLPYGLGLGAYPLALGGLVYAAWRRDAEDLALIVYCGVYFLITGAGREDFFRYLLPLVPALALLAGGVLRAVPDRWLAAGLAGCLILLLPGLYASIETDRLLGTPDSRVLAAGWLESSTVPGTRLASPYYGGPYYDRGNLERNRSSVDDPLAQGFLQGRYTTRFLLNPSNPELTLLASGPPWQAPLPTLPGKRPLFTVSAARPGAVYDPLDSFYLPIWGFEKITRPGPSISIIAGTA